MNSLKLVCPLALVVIASSAFSQVRSPTQKRKGPPPVATTIPSTGIHLESNLGSFKIKRGSEALNFGRLEVSFRGTMLVSSLKGTATPSNGAVLEFTQPNKLVYHSKGVGTLVVYGQFDGIQFFGSDLKAYYRGDGVLQLYGEFDKNLDTGSYWYDQSPTDKKYWGTSGMTLTPTPYVTGSKAGSIKIKDVPSKGG